MAEHVVMLLAGLVVFLLAVIVWAYFGPFAGALCTVSSFYLGSMFTLARRAREKPE